MCAGSCYRLGFMLSCLGGLQILLWNVDHDGEGDDDRCAEDLTLAISSSKGKGRYP